MVKQNEDVLESSDAREPRNADHGPEDSSGASAPAKPAREALLFGAVASPNVVPTVVRRLRAAIGLGFLADGDRLPKESDLATQLAVTSFALREALGVLRDEGLITTRPGKNGGSFVRARADMATLATDELRKMSATELRDLGDWRQMLASVSATLAARRASTSTTNRLRRFAEAVGTAATGVHASRAHCRFHVELAAAAQSIRMSRAEFAMYEEFDWLLGLALDDADRRRDSARDLVEITEAVAQRLPNQARAAAERHSEAIADSLVKLRLASIAADESDHGRDDIETQDLAAELVRVLDVVMASLDVLVRSGVEVLGAPTNERDVQTRLSRPAMSELVNIPLPVHGLGFLMAPGTMPGHELWIQWWQRTPEGVFADDRHVLDPNRDDFYDYLSQDCFAIPRRDGTPCVQGPYVDFGGVDDYILTFATPVFVDGRFVAACAADMEVAALERYFAPWLVAAGGECMVINAEDRVIVSNSAAHIVGDVLQSTVGRQIVDLGRFGWRLALNVDSAGLPRSV